MAIFGALDLKYPSGFFVKIEPALGNALTGVFFVGSVVVGRPVVRELAERQLGRPIGARADGYLCGVTLAWGLFFFARTALYVWMAYRLTLDQALALRALLGPISFGAMILGEMGVRYLRFGRKALGRDVEPERSPSAG